MPFYILGFRRGNKVIYFQSKSYLLHFQPFIHSWPQCPFYISIYQCDMTRWLPLLFINYLAIYTNANLYNRKNLKEGSKFSQLPNKLKKD